MKRELTTKKKLEKALTWQQQRACYFEVSLLQGRGSPELLKAELHQAYARIYQLGKRLEIIKEKE